MITVEGKAYSAINLGGRVWIVRRWDDAKSDNFVEAEVMVKVNVENTEQVAIDSAIARGSWA